MREKVKATYGVDIQSKDVLSQIAETFLSLDRLGSGMATNGGTTVLQLGGPAALALLRGEAVAAIQSNHDTGRGHEGSEIERRPSLDAGLHVNPGISNILTAAAVVCPRRKRRDISESKFAMLL